MCKIYFRKKGPPYCTCIVLIHELIKIPNHTCVFHNNEIPNNESTPRDISTLLMTLS